MKYRLEKIADNRFGGEHPKGINVGYIKEGINIVGPRVGDTFFMDNLVTSTVTEIIGIFFKTNNSTYRLTEFTPPDRREIEADTFSDESNMYHIDLDFNERGRIKGRFESSELRAIIEKLDNVIKY